MEEIYNDMYANERTALSLMRAFAALTLILISAASVSIQSLRAASANPLDNFWWVYLLAFLVMALVALLSVTWQTVRLINTDPVEALKKE